MSNHAGSYMLNSILEAGLETDLFQKAGKKRTREFMEKFLHIAWLYDCNPGEMLENIGEYFQLCYCCVKFDHKIMEDGLCEKCHNKYNSD